MRDSRLLGILRPSLALVALAAVLVMLGLAITGPAQASTKSPAPKDTKSAKAAGTVKEDATHPDGYKVQRGAEVRGGDDVIVLKGTSVPSVIAFGGDVRVDGTVEQTVVAFGGDVVVNGKVGESVVAFGGDVTVNGTVNASTVAFGGDVRLTRNANVGRDVRASDAAVVVAGGDLTRVPGARVHGQIRHSAGGIDIGHLVSIGTRGMLFNPLLGLSFAGWVAQTVFFLVLALVAAALMPKQILRVETQLRLRPWASLGWGALAFFIAIPVIFIAVGITIIGLLLWLPFGLFTLLLYFFGVTALAALLAQKVLGGFGGKENLILAVVLGVVGTTIVSRIPVVGVLALLVMTVMGTGAVILAVAERRRETREAEAARIAAQAAAAPPQYAPAAAGAVITPIVQTSPARQAAQPQQAPPQSEVPATAPQAPVTAVAPVGAVAQPVLPPQPLLPETLPSAGPEPPAAPDAPQGQIAPEGPGSDAADGPGQGGGGQPGQPAP